MPFDLNPRDAVNHNDNAMERLEKQAQGNLSSKIFEEMKSASKGSCKKSEALPESLNFDTSSIYSTAFDQTTPERLSLPEPPRFGYNQVDRKTKTAHATMKKHCLYQTVTGGTRTTRRMPTERIPRLTASTTVPTTSKCITRRNQTAPLT